MLRLPRAAKRMRMLCAIYRTVWGLSADEDAVELQPVHTSSVTVPARRFRRQLNRIVVYMKGTETEPGHALPFGMHCSVAPQHLTASNRMGNHHGVGRLSSVDAVLVAGAAAAAAVNDVWPSRPRLHSSPPGVGRLSALAAISSATTARRRDDGAVTMGSPFAIRSSHTVAVVVRLVRSRPTDSCTCPPLK